MEFRKMKELIGKTIYRVLMGEDKDNILFDCGDEFIEYRAWGECCSESWFYSISGIKNLLGQEVIGVEKKYEEVSVEPSGKRQDVDLAYGYSLKTRKGYCDIEFRNSSNGYYGGELSPAFFIREVNEDGIWV